MATFGALLGDVGPYQPKKIYVPPAASKDETFAAREADVKAWIVKNMADINTPEFKRWFGNSKVVGKDGRPLIQFHATFLQGFDPTVDPSSIKPFSAFSLVKYDADYFYHFGSLAQATERIKLIDMDVPGAASRELPDYFYFDERMRDRREHIAIYVVFLNIQNPLNIKDIGKFSGLRLAKELARLKVIGEQAVLLVTALEVQLKKRLESIEQKYAQGYAGGDRRAEDEDEYAAQHREYAQTALEYHTMMMQLIQGWLEEKGYDGLKYKNKFESVSYFRKKEQWSYAALRSEQVKAINNSGSWNPKLPDVFNGL